MNIINTNVHNRFDIEVTDALTGKIKQVVTSYNIVLDQFFTRLVGRGSKLGYIHIGSGTGTPSVTRTSLFSFLGAKAASVVETVKAYPTSYIKKKIVLSPSEYVGATITEVGFGYGTTSTYAVTHSLLKDSEGNPIAINKTDTDVLTIYATFYVTIGDSVPGVYLLPSPGNSDIIKGVLEDTYSQVNVAIGMGNTITKADDILYTSLYTKTNINPTIDQTNKMWTIPTQRWDYNIANSHMVSAIGSPTIAVWLLPNQDIFPYLNITNVAVGTGDDVKTEFTSPFPLIVPGSEVIRVNGVVQTRDVDYEINYNNNAKEYPELFISALPNTYSITGGNKHTTYSYRPYFIWHDQTKVGINAVSEASPIYLDFGSPITVNRFIIPQGSFTFGGSGTFNTIMTFDYSDDKTTWNNLFTSGEIAYNSITADLWFDPPITARYFRFTSSFLFMVGCGSCPNIRFGYVTPGIKFMVPPANGATIEMDCQLDRPIKNSNWVIDFGFSVKFERG